MRTFKDAAGDAYGQRIYDAAKEGQVNQVSYKCPKPGPDKTPVPKVSFVTAVAGPGCGVGTAAHGAVLYTASEAVLRGFNVIVPVDGVSAENTYIEQYVAYNFTSAPIISAKVDFHQANIVWTTWLGSNTGVSVVIRWNAGQDIEALLTCC